MQAIEQRRYGGTEVWQLSDRPRPAMSADEVIVEVRAAGMDRGTWHLMTGLPYLGRAMFGMRRPRQPVPGLDLAGVVVEVGAEVTRFAVGDEVFGIGKGSFAELAAAPEKKLSHKPDALPFEQAAAVPVSGLTAIQAVCDQADVQPGQSVLVIGASGGVGTYAVQVAKVAGAEVTGVCSTAKVDLVRSLGADHVIDYTTDDFADGANRYDVIVDVGGNSTLGRLRRALTERGTLVIVGGEEGGRWLGGIDRQLHAMLVSPLVSQRLTTFVSREHHDGLDRLAELIDAGQVTPAVDAVYPLADAPHAMDRLFAGEVRGKVVLRP
ncbi:MAG: NAD(P)-dependent alcohol dehydrogenase [Acidimicrobiia bacterium]|nr:NAD(P)-dependent alcohol dehydrogenase [Acidimicrobiia bacterium]